jgi:hypothetical protein
MASSVSVLPSFYHLFMFGLILFFAIIMLVKGWALLRSRRESTVSAGDQDNVTVVRRPLLTTCEMKFFRALQEAVGTQYLIFTQLPLWTMIETATKDRKRSGTFRNKISLKRVDFVLVDTATLEPYLVIELDDRSHAREKRVKRDAFITSVLDVAGIPLVRILASPAYSVPRLRHQLGLEISRTRSA